MTNNVAPKVHNLNDFHKEGTGTKTVVLFACTLFLILQVYSFFLLSRETDTLDRYLDVLDKRFLSVASFDPFSSGLQSKQSVTFASQDISHLSPFFFEPIPINFCEKSLLLSVRGIGPNLAKRILQARNSKGNFTDPEQLLEIKGIGSAKLSLIKPYFDFSKNNEHK